MRSMLLNWQNILTALIVMAALIYVSRRALSHLRSLRDSRRSAPCETACGGCGESGKPSTTPRTVFVEIGRSRTLPRRTTR
ncbi:MAG TPA: FeoB-associated Cys-rich membrane protein [Pyrinomonadaceae bacterium]|jgi:hypothetical protein